AQLEKLPDFIDKRRENFSPLYNGLKDLSEFIILPQTTPDSEPSWFGFIITLKNNIKFNRNDIVQYLESHGIQTRNLFAGNMVRQPAFDTLIKDVDYRVIGDLSVTDKVMNDSFWIGLYPGLSPIAIQFMVKTIREFIHKYG
ncbi:MAG: lipopolysaccharide biosynthesis protein RfbH, partial [Crenarchaeota archaeon]|nr:lipopolysaccharide biosynthesis protein RfbH [Thermoproteota archaeon]